MPNSRRPPANGRPNYGIDRPDIVFFLIAAGFVTLILGVFSYVFTLYEGLASSLIFFAFASSFVIGSKVFKVKQAERLLNSITWRGDETVLDVGCGRGLLLISAAKHLRSGKAVGIDIWNKMLQSGNSPENTIRNARIAGVAERVEVRDGDARHLPFGDETFDIVVTSLVLHHVPKSERRKTLSEIFRVLKPGGQLAMIELFHAREFSKILSELGMRDVQLSPSQFGLFSGGRTLVASKSGN